ncbi:MAG: tetratricopeptide repeat protein [Gammaproteobacteria bacterium]|nr:tetratricopeptide repeat protein [Gammaproteobacteria bacterium]
MPQFRKLISRHMGLNIPDQDESALSELLAARSNALKFPSAANYCRFLEGSSQESEQEWKHLARHLTIGESYFFRDTGQIGLLEKVILPALLEKNANAHSLRLLSAGCATGEEPYTLAILLDRLVPAWQPWQTRIFGIDINEESLNTARKGMYSNWSFRGVPPELKAQYFQKQGINWLLDGKIRARVTFRRLNLVKDPFPSEVNEIQKMDLILCRNVNIYFNTETITRLVDKFANTLNPGGYLLTGHAELQGIVHPLLYMKSYPESVVYQRIGALSGVPPVVAPLPFVFPRPPPPVAAAAKPAAPVKKPSVASPSPEQVRALFREGRYHEVIVKAKQIVARDPRHLGAWQLMARACANLGQHQEAEACCERMLKINAFSAYAYYLKAHIAMDRGDESETKALLKKALYLNYTFIAPHLELAEIHAKEGDTRKAKKMRIAACELLRALPAGAQVEMIDAGTAGSLLQDVEKLL